MKYIMLQREVDGEIQNIPIIFPADLAHIEVKEAIQKAYPECKRVVSAGFIHLNDIVIEPKVKSDTLNIEPRRVDTMIIETYDFTRGFVWKG